MKFFITKEGCPELVDSPFLVISGKMLQLLYYQTISTSFISKVRSLPARG